MPDDLRKARALVGKLPSQFMIKLHIGQCIWLGAKLRETLDRVEKEQGSCRACSKVFRELRLVAQRVKTFVDDCCYKGDKDFVLAAISVLAHKERFVKYCVELDWCMFLLKDANGESMGDGFEWERNVNKLVADSRSVVEKDLKHFRELLRQYVRKPGDHQKICATLLRRFEDVRDAHHLLSPGHHVDDLGVPPVETRGHCIGTGGFGGVYEFNWKKTEFALKVPLPDRIPTLETEVAILERCCHPNIVNLILFHRKPDGKQYLMMERLSMDLLEYIETEFPFPPSEAVDMILQVCEGMRYLSDEKQVSHRDLKPRNILVKVGGNQVLELQVADFGLAKVRAALERSSENNTPNQGTTRYRAPEMTVESQGQKLQKIREKAVQADMYSFAVTCSCILTGCEPYQEILDKPRGMEELKNFVNNGGRPTLPDECPLELSSLLRQCWHAEPSKRPASFSEVCEELRKLKAKLLTCGVDEGDELEESTSEAQVERVTFNAGDRPLRILVLGDPYAVQAALRLICGDSECIVEDHMDMRERRSASPPMCLYRNQETTFGNDFTDIQNFVEARNRRWHLEQVKATWKEDLYSLKGTALFPNSSLRLHMVWFVCTSVADLPNSFQWDEITKKLCGLPVQMLVTGTNEYENILQHRLRFFGEDQNLEELIMRVDLTDAVAKQRLWRTCWEVKTRAEIENAAMIIREIRKELGASGIVIPVGVASRRTRAFSVKRSKQFMLNFLCTYWDIPQSFVNVLVERIRTQQEPKFVLFCLQNAASILYREREYLHGMVPAEGASPEFLEREARALSVSYFENLDLAACEKMKCREIRAFLQAVFEGQACPLVCEPDQNLFFSKLVRRLGYKGPL